MELAIFNTQGKKINTLDRGYKAPGYKIYWKGDDDYSNSVSNGIYIVSLKTYEQIILKKYLNKAKKWIYFNNYQ